MIEQLRISDNDIRFVATTMGGYDFSDVERTQAIKHLDSCDIQACPGSGKTTALAAKLIILSRKLPNNTGICVLSHTNAARDEITKHVSRHAGRLLHYPNFIGTIQQFADRFIAIPAMVAKYGIRPSAIDDEILGAVVKNYYGTVPRKLKLFYSNKASRWEGDGSEFLKRLRYSFRDSERLCVFENGKEEDFGAKVSTPSHKAAWQLKETMTKEGYIGYHDAYSLANWYLEKHPELCACISSRFPLVFIDEMQDTDLFQAQVIDKFFNNGSCVVQCLGDTNQTIYSGRSDYSEAGWKPINPLQISHSYRLSRSIAALTENVCQTPQKLDGNHIRPDRAHSIFLYNASNIQEVLNEFGRLISLEKLNRGPFKAVGYVKGPNKNDRVTISSYWPAFSKVARSNRQQDTIGAFFNLAKKELVENYNCGEACSCLIDGLLQLLRIEGIKQENGKWYSRSTFLNHLKNDKATYDGFRQQLLAWCTELKYDKKLGIDIVAQQMKDTLVSILPGGINFGLSSGFVSLDVDESSSASSVQTPSATNIYYHQTSAETIPIHIDTIHGVKGQTHQATLVLDTFWFDYHLQRLLPYLIGDRRDGGSIQKRDPRRLNLAYVAMTRPTDLLCLAMSNDSVNSEDISKLESRGWNIVNL